MGCPWHRGRFHARGDAMTSPKDEAVTEAMIEAARKTVAWSVNVSDGEYRAIYTAMRDATPVAGELQQLRAFRRELEDWIAQAERVSVSKVYLSFINNLKRRLAALSAGGGDTLAQPSPRKD